MLKNVKAYVETLRDVKEKDRAKKRPRSEEPMESQSGSSGEEGTGSAGGKSEASQNQQKERSTNSAEDGKAAKEAAHKQRADKILAKAAADAEKIKDQKAVKAKKQG